jgi:hypothetical protein
MSVLTEARPNEAVTEEHAKLNPTISIIEITPDVDPKKWRVDLEVAGEGIQWDYPTQTLTLQPPADKRTPVTYEIPITISIALPEWRFASPAAELGIKDNTSASVLYFADTGEVETALSLLNAVPPNDEVHLDYCFYFKNSTVPGPVRIDPTLILKPPSGP